MTSGRHFGVPAVDRTLGEVPPGGIVLFRHDPGIQASEFVLQATAKQLQEGHDVVYAVTDRSPSRILEVLAEQAPDAPRGRLHLVDAHSALMGAGTTAEFPIQDPTDLLQVAARLEQAARAHPKAALMVDSMSSLLDHADEARFLGALPRLVVAMRRFAMTGAVWTSWPYSEDVDKALAAVDAVVRLRGVEEGVMLHQSLAIERAGWLPGAKSTPPMLYKVDRPAGILVYVPKIVVLGPAAAGKSTFVHSLASEARSVDRMGTTVTMDRGTATLDGVKVEVFGTPGQARFDPLLPTLAGQAVGAILLVDATMPTSFKRAKGMLDKISRRGLRVVIALNKSDLPDALTPAKAKAKLDAPPGIEILACSAKDPASAQRVLRHLVDSILLAPAGGVL